MINVEDHAAHCRMAREIIINSLYENSAQGNYKTTEETHDKKNVNREPEKG